MLAIEFETYVKGGVIKIPEKYKGKLAKHIKVIALMDEQLAGNDVVQYSDNYIEKHWREMLAQGLAHYGDSYYKSEQYMLDRGKEGVEK